MHAEHSLSASIMGSPSSPDTPGAVRWPLSLLLRLRPHSYPAASVAFANTCYLGFFSMLLLVSLVISGLVLLLPYDPRPEFAQLSVWQLAQHPALAWVRDLHRLTADLLVTICLLHLLRVVLAAAYKGPRRFTWVGGLGLFLVIIGLWGSGMVLSGGEGALAVLASFGSVIGISAPAALGSSYLLHVAILPLAAATLVAIHHYRVHWLHGISLPVCATARRSLEDRRPVPFWPTLARRELRLALYFVAAIFLAAVFVYDAPVEMLSGDAAVAESSTAWFVLWLRGALALCPHPLWSVFFAAASIVLLFSLPWIERRQRRPLGQRRGVLYGVGLVVALVLLLVLLGGSSGEGDVVAAIVVGGLR